MRVVKIELLKEGSFWFFQNLQLSPMERVSEPLNWSALAPGVKASIARSQNQFRIIRIVDCPKGTKPTFNLEDPEGNMHQPGFPNTGRKIPPPKFIEPEEETVEEKEEIISITMSKEEEEEIDRKEEVDKKDEINKEDEIEEVVDKQVIDIVTVDPDEEEEDEVRLLLSKNGNTVKKFLRNLELVPSNIPFVNMCIGIESDSKNRLGVISDLKKKLAELKTGDTEWV